MILDGKKYLVKFPDSNRSPKLKISYINNVYSEYIGSRIKYYDFITKLENKDCIDALIRIYPKIDIEKIYNVIDEISCITNIRKNFYKTIIKYKYEDILQDAYKRGIK